MPKPRSPPRVEDPSRRPAASSACTWVTQPGPSCQVSLTRSTMAPGLLPAAPANLRSCSLTASVSTGPNGAVGAGQLGHRGRQGVPVGLGGTVDGAERELGPEVDEQLVAARGDAVAQRLDRVGAADLVGPHLGPQGGQGLGRVGGGVAQVGGTLGAWGGGRGCGRRRLVGRSRRAQPASGRPSPVRPRPRLVVHHRGVGGEDDGGVAGGVHDLRRDPVVRRRAWWCSRPGWPGSVRWPRRPRRTARCRGRRARERRTSGPGSRSSAPGWRTATRAARSAGCGRGGPGRPPRPPSP